MRPKEFSPTLLVLAANILVYSVIAYAGLSVFGRGLSTENMRAATTGLLFPVIILAGLACTSRFNPLWPRGMTELTAQEKELQQELPLAMRLEGVRNVLRSRRIQFREKTEASQSVVLENEKGGRMTAVPGDRVVSARLQTKANQFPCGYDIKIVLLFGQDERMKQQHIQRLRLCP